jgi:hypothetical protein
MTDRRARALALLLAAATIAGPAAAQVIPTGNELVLSPAHDSRQRDATPGLRKKGSQVVWEDERLGILGRAFNLAGAPLGAVQTFAASDPLPAPPFVLQLREQHEPALAMRKDGGFLLVWSEWVVERRVSTFSDTSRWLSARLLARFYKPDGRAAGNPFEIAKPAGFAGRPAIAAAADGSFWIAWHELAGAARGIHIRRLDKKGKLGGDVRVALAGERPSIAIAADTFLVVWERPVGASTQVAGRLFKTKGGAVGTLFNISRTPGTRGARPAVAGQTYGEFLVVWEGSPTANPGDIEVYGQAISKLGSFLGPELSLAVGRGDRHGSPRVAALGTGWVAAWRSFDQFLRLGVDGVALDRMGNDVGTPAAFSSTLPSGFEDVGLVTSKERVLVTWSGYANGGSGDVVVRSRNAKSTK